MARPKPISGFPEFLPEQRMIEQQAIDILRDTFELHGFAPIETRAVEPISQLSRKGEITKEVYAVRRLHGSERDTDELGLHFDLTVPFARYVLENSANLDFPFARYQIQKVWRGERPQEGRYREFVQADIDIVGRETLPTHYDVELPLVMLEALEKLHLELGLPSVRMHVNNRKLSEGFYRGLGIQDTSAVLQRVDKFDKIGAEGVKALLVDEIGLTLKQAEKCVQLAQICTPDESFAEQVYAIGVKHEMLTEGIEALTEVIGAANSLVPGRMVADLKIARGLDYYTGTVYETELSGFESMGSISSGGRYDSLASDGKTTYPGVGISLGLTRVLAPLMANGKLQLSRKVPSCVLVAVESEETRGEANQVASLLRARNISCQVSPDAAKFGKQIRHADRRGIPFVWFGSVKGQVKDIRSGEQTDADANSWCPPEEDLRPHVLTKLD